jgi:hypothetical protein
MRPPESRVVNLDEQLEREHARLRLALAGPGPLKRSAVRGTRCSSSSDFSQHSVVYLDEQVEKDDARVLQNRAPGGAQQSVCEVAAFGR